MKKFMKVFIYCTGLAALCLIMQAIASVPVTVFFIVKHSLPHILSGNPEAFMSVDINRVLHDTVLPAYLLSGVLTFSSSWIIHALFRRKFIERLSFKRTSPVLIIVSFITGCSLQMPISFIMALLENAGVAPDLFEQYSKSIEPLVSNQNIILQILAVGIMAPLIEEIIFRGLIFNNLKKNIPIPAALVIQALLFGIVHLNIIQGSYAFVVGIILGLFVLWSNSLFLPVAVHMGMNLSGIVLSEFGEGISNTGSMFMLIISFILVPVCMLFLYFKTREKTIAENYSLLG